MSENPFSKFLLTFKDPLHILNQLYYRQHKNESKVCSKTITIYGEIVVAIYLTYLSIMFSFAEDQSTQDHYCFLMMICIGRIIYLAIALAILFIPRADLLHGTFLIICLHVDVSELNVYFKTGGIPADIILVNILGVLVGSIVCYNWIAAGVSYLIGMSYFFLRVTIFGNNFCTSPLTRSVKLVIALLFLIYICYEKEMMYKYWFFQKYLNSKQTQDLKDIIWNLPDGMLIVREENKNIQFYNPSLLNILAIPLQPLLEQREHERRDQRDRTDDFASSIYTQQLPQFILSRLQDPDICSQGIEGLYNEITPREHSKVINTPELKVEICGYPIHFENQICKVLLFKDQKNYYELEREKSKQNYKNLLLKTISHELKTPLNSLLGNFELIHKSTLELQTKEYAQNGIKNSHILLSLINNTITFSKMEANEFQIMPTQFNPIKLLKECFEMYSADLEQKKLSSKIEVNPEFPHYISTDQSLLKQIIMIILGNAVKYTFSGFINITLDIKTPKSEYIFRICDSGIGIPPSKLSGIFELFENPETAMDQSHGINFGLTMAKRFLEYLRGNISIYSEKDKGTTVEITLRNEEEESSSVSLTVSEFSTQIPLVPVLNIHSATAFSPKMEARKTKRLHSTKCSKIPPKKIVSTPKILIVDDVAYNLLVLKGMLKSLKMEPQEAMNGVEAVNLVIEQNKKDTLNNYDLIFMDLQMPIMNGFEATKILKQKMKDGVLPEIPIIAITAYEDENSHLQCSIVGFDFVAHKPITLKKITEILKNFGIIS